MKSERAKETLHPMTSGKFKVRWFAYVVWLSPILALYVLTIGADIIGRNIEWIRQIGSNTPPPPRS